MYDQLKNDILNLVEDSGTMTVWNELHAYANDQAAHQNYVKYFFTTPEGQQFEKELKTLLDPYLSQTNHKTVLNQIASEIYSTIIVERDKLSDMRFVELFDNYKLVPSVFPAESISSDNLFNTMDNLKLEMANSNDNKLAIVSDLPKKYFLLPPNNIYVTYHVVESLTSEHKQQYEKLMRALENLFQGNAEQDNYEHSLYIQAQHALKDSVNPETIRYAAQFIILHALRKEIFTVWQSMVKTLNNIGEYWNNSEKLPNIVKQLESLSNRLNTSLNERLQYYITYIEQYPEIKKLVAQCQLYLNHDQASLDTLIATAKENISSNNSWVTSWKNSLQSSPLTKSFFGGSLSSNSHDTRSPKTTSPSVLNTKYRKDLERKFSFQSTTPTPKSTFGFNFFTTGASSKSINSTTNSDWLRGLTFKPAELVIQAAENATTPYATSAPINIR
ncbi:MAG: hypothetical protein Tsb005_17400 [Gammaproteobacteria bacterium]